MFRGGGFWGACVVWVVAAWLVRGWVWVFVWVVGVVAGLPVCSAANGLWGWVFARGGWVLVWCFGARCGGWPVFLLCARGCACVLRVLWCVLAWLVSVLLGCCPCVFGCSRASVGLVLLRGAIALALVGGRGCLGAGCVVAGGVLPSWLGDAVASGGVSVGFDVGERVFTLGGVGAPASGSSSAVSGSVSVSGSVVPVSPDAGVGASGSSLGVGGVRVCVPCARAVFGESWCSLVLRRWARAAGVDGAKVDTLLGSAPVSGFVRSVVSGGAASSRVSGLSSPSCSPSPVSARGSASLRSASAGGGRVGVGFGARVRDWGARVGVGGGVVSGGGVVASWWAGWCSRVRALVSGVGVWGLVLAGLVGVVVLVSVLVLVG